LRSVKYYEKIVLCLTLVVAFPQLMFALPSAQLALLRQEVRFHQLALVRKEWLGL
jgi:hypothetical protein